MTSHIETTNTPYEKVIKVGTNEELEEALILEVFKTKDGTRYANVSLSHSGETGDSIVSVPLTLFLDLADEIKSNYKDL